MKILSFLIFSVFFIQIILVTRGKEPPPKHLVRPKALYCETDNQTFSTKYCFIKPYSRFVVTLNLGFTALVSLTKPFYIQAVLFYRYGTIFRQIINTKPIEFCNVMEGSATNPLISSWINMFNNTFPKLFHKCPYDGDIEIFNITLKGSPNKENEIFPQGYYRIVFTVLKNNKVIVKVRLEGENTSTIKESFG